MSRRTIPVRYPTLSDVSDTIVSGVPVGGVDTWADANDATGILWASDVLQYDYAEGSGSSYVTGSVRSVSGLLHLPAGTPGASGLQIAPPSSNYTAMRVRAQALDIFAEFYTITVYVTNATTNSLVELHSFGSPIPTLTSSYAQIGLVVDPGEPMASYDMPYASGLGISSAGEYLAFSEWDLAATLAGDPKNIIVAFDLRTADYLNTAQTGLKKLLSAGSLVAAVGLVLEYAEEVPDAPYTRPATAAGRAGSSRIGFRRSTTLDR